MRKLDFFLKYSFILTSLILILPNLIREVPFAIVGLFSIIIYFKEKLYQKRDFLIFLYFLVCLISLIYTTDLIEGFKQIEGLLPVMYLSFAFLVFKRKQIINLNIIKKWLLIFNYSNLFFLIIYAIYLFLNFDEISYNNIRTALDEIPLIKIHPIYFSILGVITILLNLKFKDLVQNYFLFAFVGFIMINISGVRATFLSIPLLIILLIGLMRISVFYKLRIFLSVAFLIVLIGFLNKDLIKRFSEVFSKQTFERVNLDNSTSIRYAVWDCSLSQINETNMFFGKGIGDVRKALQNCYNEKYTELNKYYNTHNQYLFFYLTVGLLGLFSFLISIFEILKDSNKNKYLIIILSFFLYMFLFENVLERKYGILIFYFSMMFTFNLFELKAENNIDKKN